MKFNYNNVTDIEFKKLYKKGIDNVGITKQYISTSESYDKDNCITFICSTEDVDRQNDVVMQDGIDFTHFIKNPVVFFGHETDKFPIGKVIDISVKNKKLYATIEFIPNTADYDEAGRKAHSIFCMVKNGFLNCVSIGFFPTEFDQAPDRENGFDFYKCELNEISIVGIPANPNALVVPESIPVADKSAIQGVSSNPEDFDPKEEVKEEPSDKKHLAYNYIKMYIDAELLEDES